MTDLPLANALRPAGTEPVSLVVTDLDGTLWDRHGRAHDLTLGALRELEERGLPVLAATARRPASALKVMNENKLLLPAVLLDGSLGKDFASGVTFHRHAFEPALAARVLAELDTLGIEPCVNLDAEPRDVMVGPNPSTCAGHLRFIEPWRLDGDLAQTVLERPVLSFVVCGRERELLQPAIEAVREIATGSVTPDLGYGGYSLSLRPFGVSKWNGVLAYCQAYGIDSTRVLAVGDGENDVELLQSAAIACAVDDGCDAVLQLAHHRLAPAHQGGWRGVLDLLNG